MEEVGVCSTHPAGTVSFKGPRDFSFPVVDS
jgi:hypothetical protein